MKEDIRGSQTIFNFMHIYLLYKHKFSARIAHINKDIRYLQCSLYKCASGKTCSLILKIVNK